MVSGDVTPPVIKSAIPTAKEKKYDRQLRLWAASGQQALEDARILLLNNDPGVVGVETLKNLVLPGVGSFTVVDGATVTEADLGTNFFLEESSLGKSRAAETSKYLKELNPEVVFHAVEESPADYVDEHLLRLRNHTLIILIGPCKETEKILDIAYKDSIPLFYVHCMGFYSCFSIQLPALFPIVDTHPDPASTQDLRLLNPWPELATYQQSITKELSSLDDHAHGHVPYVLILLHYLEEWKASYNGYPPSTYSQKKEFAKLVSSGARTSNPEGGEENFDEATAAVLKSLNRPSISPGLREILEETTWDSLTPECSAFWWIACAINDFHNTHDGLLPLPGTLPDMKAQSADYIHLQTLYKQKATSDIAEVTAIINSHNPPHPIPATEIAEFCKNAAHVKLIRGRRIRLRSGYHKVPGHYARFQGPTAWEGREKALAPQLLDETSLLPIYIAFEAYDFNFDSTPAPIQEQDEVPFNREVFLDHFLTDAITIASELVDANPSMEADPDDLDERGVPDPVFEPVYAAAKELWRGLGTELHNIAALTGGMVAQEVIKVVTRQYVPVDNTCVFDGVGSRTQVFQFGELA